MLNAIKSLINNKKTFMEAADLILEGEELDDSIVLDEKPIPEPEEPAEDETLTEPNEEENPEEGNEAPEEQPLPLPGTEELPAPAEGDDNADILTAEIDLTTNTQTDILPVPPANASDAIVGDDFMNQTIDSGFGDDEEKPAITNTIGTMADQVDEATDIMKGLASEEDMEKDREKKEEANKESFAESEDIMKGLVDDGKIEKFIKDKEEANKKVYKESEGSDAEVGQEITEGDKLKAADIVEMIKNAKHVSMKELEGYGDGKKPIDPTVIYVFDKDDEKEMVPIKITESGDILIEERAGVRRMTPEVAEWLKKSIEDKIKSGKVPTMKIEDLEKLDQEFKKNKEELQEKNKENMAESAETDDLEQKIKDLKGSNKEYKAKESKHIKNLKSWLKATETPDHIAFDTDGNTHVPGLNDGWTMDDHRHAAVNLKDAIEKAKAARKNGILDNREALKDLKKQLKDAKKKELSESVDEYDEYVEFVDSEEFDKLLMEAISIDGAAPADDTTSTEPAAETPTEDNSVTAAVKDKVDEINADQGGSSTQSLSASKEELMKKLSSLTKSIEDAKNLVLSGMQ